MPLSRRDVELRQAERCFGLLGRLTRPRLGLVIGIVMTVGIATLLISGINVLRLISTGQSDIMTYAPIPDIVNLFNATEALLALLGNDSDPSASTRYCWRLHELHYPALRIPAIVHWTSRRGKAMKRHEAYLATWPRVLRNASMKFRYVHWSDAELDRLIRKHYPSVHLAYRHLANGLERSDIGRLVILHHVGGIYVDLDVSLLRDVSDLLVNYSAVWPLEPEEHSVFLFNRSRLLANAVMMSQPGHVFLTYVLSRWPAWFQRTWARRERVTYDAVFATGPLMLDDFYSRYVAENEGIPEAESEHRDMIGPSSMFQPQIDVTIIPKQVRRICQASKHSVLNLEKQRLCRDFIGRNFTARPVTPKAYTVHWYLHTGYAEQKDKRIDIGKVLPLSDCII